MTPTLRGRFETRLFLILAVGIPWTLLVTPLLVSPLPYAYRVTLTAVAVMAVVGFAWDCIYYALQQLRWDKDWPSLFALLNGLNEGVTTWIGLELFARIWGWTVSPIAFVILFASTWLLMFLAMQGPMRVLLPRWRFRGARVV